MEAVVNHPSAVTAQTLTGRNVTPMASGSGSTGNSASNDSSSSAAITANDFLTLLVTEMKNQDPTATTDPNEYINQLVQVNSLQQLISINQNLSTALGGSPTGASGQSVAASAPASPSTSNPAHTPVTSGNLDAPDATPASLRVAQALSVQSKAHTVAGGLSVTRSVTR